ncbi:unnamed protein product, partial [Trichobilharzia regenti]
MRMELDARRKSRRKRRRLQSVDIATGEGAAAAAEGEAKEDGLLPEQEEEETEDVRPPAALDIIKILCNPGIRKRHWDAMSEIAGRDLTPDSGTSLAKILQMNLDPYMEEFAGISTGASKEFTLETNMNKMRDDWTEISFGLIPYRESGIFILASVDDT